MRIKYSTFRKIIILTVIIFLIYFGNTSAQKITTGRGSVYYICADSTISASSSQTFRWDLLNGAVKYQLQIAKPNFTAPLTYLLDTNICIHFFN